MSSVAIKSGIPTASGHEVNSSSHGEKLHPVVLLLKYWVNSLPHSNGQTALDQAVTVALETSLKEHLIKVGIENGDGYLEYASNLLKWTPTEHHDSKDIYDTLCLFYFVLDQAPLSDMQTPIDPKSVGAEPTFLSAWLVTYAQVMGQWMDHPDSITDETFDTFRNAEKYRVWECVEPEGGFKTFNEFFHRHLKDGARPIAQASNSKVVVYPADCAFDAAFDVERDNTIKVKNLKWKIKDLLEKSNYADRFKGGVWIHAFLSTFNYHRLHAPVAGTIKEATVIQGLAFLDVKAGEDGKRRKPIKHIRTLPRASQPEHANGAGPKAEDGSGYQFLQTRGMIVIDAGDNLGYVAVLPIGMAQVSSVMLSVKKGMKVEKGQEIGYFRFGGSDIVVVFQSKAGLSKDSFRSDPAEDWNKMGSELVVLND